MRSTTKTAHYKKRRKGRQMTAVYLRVPHDIHSLVTDLALKAGKPTSHLYRELIESAINAEIEASA